MFALQITVDTKSAPTEVTADEVALLQASFRSRGIQIEYQDAKNLAEEYRYLAHEYLKDHELPKKILNNFKLELEKQIASHMIREMEERVDLSDDVLKSYYVSHKDEFLRNPSVKLDIYRFETFDNAAAFYERFKNDQTGIEAYAQEHNITSEAQNTLMKRLNKTFRQMIKYEERSAPFMLTPQFFYDHYSVIRVAGIRETSQRPYEKCIDDIKAKVHEEALSSMKEKLLENYRSESAKQ